MLSNEVLKPVLTHVGLNIATSTAVNAAGYHWRMPEEGKDGFIRYTLRGGIFGHRKDGNLNWFGRLSQFPFRLLHIIKAKAPVEKATDNTAT